MPRAKRIFQADFPYHITNRSVNRVPFPLDMETLWKLFSKRLNECAIQFKIEIHAFVLMTNHYHLLVRCPENNLSVFMAHFNGQLSKTINFQSGKINQNFGNRYGATVVGDPRYYLTVYRYVYRNPVEAGLSSSVETYPYSSLQIVLEQTKNLFPVHDYPILEDKSYCALTWLNQDYKKEEKQKIRIALKKASFRL